MTRYMHRNQSRADHPTRALTAALVAMGAAAAPARAATLDVPSQYATIQAAIDQAVNGDEVVVAAGTYQENINLGTKAITVRAADLGDKPVLTGAGGQRVLFGYGVGPDTILRGFVIQQGSGTFGGGMLINYGAPHVEYCEFIGNSATFGAGVYVSGPAVFAHCVFRGNNATVGGGVYTTDGAKFDGCVFAANGAVIAGALAGGYGDLRLTNCLFVQNGGQVAILCTDGTTELINCTLAGHNAWHLFNSYGALIIKNSILWGNSSNLTTGSTTVVISSSNVQGGAAGAGNINTDPLFVDPDGADNMHGTDDDDYRLQPTSPCIDIGDNTALPLETTLDAAGWPRVLNLPGAPACTQIPPVCDDTSIVDLGAYEYSACDPMGETDLSFIDRDGDGVLNDCEGCPDDPNKFDPGICGCGAIETDCDGDGIPNAYDICPDAGDTDGDEVDDCEDGCPNDPNKLDPGACGCGVAEADNNGDGVPDCLSIDLCPNDPNKTNPSACGCGVPDADNDGDGVPDCFAIDLCPNDPNKTQPGACGCGVADSDDNGDGIPDCISFDLCPDDPNKTLPGPCGCGVPDADEDQDGVPDCFQHEQGGPTDDPAPIDGDVQPQQVDEPLVNDQLSAGDPPAGAGGPLCGLGSLSPVFLGAMPLMWARRRGKARRQSAM